MRGIVTAVVAIALWGVGLSGAAWAQEPVTIVSAPPQARQERFLGLDLFRDDGGPIFHPCARWICAHQRRDTVAEQRRVGPRWRR